jgi:predicted nuclease of predicted toxin-antitoxin system
MNIVADESIDGPIVARLRTDGHAVRYVAEIEPGIVDADVLSLAEDQNSLLLTADKDFGELIFRRGLVKHGIVLFRLAGVSPREKAEIASQTITKHGDDLLVAFSVVTEKSVRVRKTG